MSTFILKVYDYMRTHRKWGILSFIVLTIMFVILVLRIEYKEDISDFLPLAGEHNNALNVYQNISGADKIFVIFQYSDSTEANPDMITHAIDAFVDNVERRDTTHIVKAITAQVDLDEITDATDFIYGNIPYFLTDADYARIDSILTQESYIVEQLQQDKQMLMFPSGGLLSENIQRDPLNLFTPIVTALQATANDLMYELYEGYIFSPDMQKAIVMIDSPFGASETENNTQLVAMLKECANMTIVSEDNIDIHIIGVPVIAVGNANQIKSDSILSVSCAIILILLLLFIVFRNVRNILLIVVSICWGWLFGLGFLSLINQNISVIVLGMSSVIMGIAVNYPLHLIAHFPHTTDKRSAVREIAVPLLVGNITTVGAFLALVPLRSTALRDLGLFSSFLLIGTILFVLIYLPHVAKAKYSMGQTVFSRLGNITLENKPYLVWIVIILTFVFGYYSLQTKFDANMANINYMTNNQKEDMSYFQNMMKDEENIEKVYVLASGNTMDEALDKSMNAHEIFQQLRYKGIVNNIANINQFISSKQEQKHRLNLWNDFTKRYRNTLETALKTYSKAEGFNESSFDNFYDILDGNYMVQPFDYFHPLTQSVFSGYFSSDSSTNHFNVVSVLSVPKAKVSDVEDYLNKKDVYSFDAMSMNSAIANNLSNDFNYIGWACGCIVFFFLWLSLGSLELAILSFIPMAVSWVWILGLMAIFGIQFNIVNIILATFIFGQGDDYTIFMTEGACYEYAYRRKILSSYKNSIVISALIMFIGIGSLIFAKHPALHSLAEVTIVGMLSVVLMAYVFPPLIYKWLVRSSHGAYRTRPLSLVPMIRMAFCFIVFFAQLFTVYLLGFILFVILKKKNSLWEAFHRYVRRLFHFDLTHIPSVELNIINPHKENFYRPAIIVSNHQSMLDSAVFMMLIPKCILVSNKHASTNFVIKQVYKWMGFITLSEDINQDLTEIQSYIAKGYSIVIFPEGERNPQSSILRFHKGAFYIAEQQKLDIVPVILHGLNDVLPRNSISVFKGKITISINQRIAITDTTFGNNYVERTKNIHRYYIQKYQQLANTIETANYYADFVKDRYRYKGYDIFHSVVKNLKLYHNYSQWLDNEDVPPNVIIVNNGYGEFALLFAMVHPLSNVIAVNDDADKSTILKYSAEGIVKNLDISTCEDSHIGENDYIIYLVEPTEEDLKRYQEYRTTIIKHFI